jgi:phenylpropionate dioxygenase-like ring-hydroxylating dioxygenase large terminal subunit
MQSGMQATAFVFDNWYVAGLSTDVTSQPLARRICNRPIVLFRTQGGQVAALEDRCLHRGMPLSDGGICADDAIICPYHGLTFNSQGECIAIPGQDRIPSSAKIRAYPVEEKDALVWIWMGDPAKADATQIISYSYHTDPAWVWTRGSMVVNANWQFLNDNLLDLSHLQHVHKKTIGGNPEEDARAEFTAERVGIKVRVNRWLRDMDAPPFHRQVAGFTGRIDRWQEIEFRPGILQFYSGAMDANTGAFDGRRDGGMHLRHFHAITPQTDHSTVYMFTLARNFQIDNAKLTEQMQQLAVKTFEEDKLVLEAQQARLLEAPDPPFLGIKNDVATVYARRIVEELVAAERGA